MTSTTGTSIETYLAWVRMELEKRSNIRDYGHIGIIFTICRGQVTDVKKDVVETDHYPLERIQGANGPEK